MMVSVNTQELMACGLLIASCEYCGKEFIQSKKNHRFCTHYCAIYHNTKKKGILENKPLLEFTIEHFDGVKLFKSKRVIKQYIRQYPAEANNFSHHLLVLSRRLQEINVKNSTPSGGANWYPKKGQLCRLLKVRPLEYWKEVDKDE